MCLSRVCNSYKMHARNTEACTTILATKKMAACLKDRYILAWDWGGLRQKKNYSYNMHRIGFYPTETASIPHAAQRLLREGGAGLLTSSLPRTMFLILVFILNWRFIRPQSFGSKYKNLFKI